MEKNNLNPTPHKEKKPKEQEKIIEYCPICNREMEQVPGTDKTYCAFVHTHPEGQ